MSYYNKSNAAYDFSRFAPAEELPAEDEKQEPARPKPKKRLVKKKAVRPATVVKWVFVSLFVMMSLSSIMFGNIKINQMNDQVTNEQKVLDNENSKQVSLASKLASRTTMTEVEEYAANLGLVKAQSYQIQYVQLTNKDKVEVSGDAGGITGFFKNLINSVLEYFS